MRTGPGGGVSRPRVNFERIGIEQDLAHPLVISSFLDILKIDPTF